MSDQPILAAKWPEKEYALLDSGNFEKLERFGSITLRRPEPLALWPQRDPSAWANADITYVPKGKEGHEGDWKGKTPPADWRVTRGPMTMRLRLTAFKHLGIFPEQAVNWDWIMQVIKPEMTVLNLFGYSGGATLAAASTGASVVHVDASRPAVEWTKENARLSGLGEAKIRFLMDDAVKFVQREIRRGNSYDAIFLDPPAFGRGPDGELWKFERDLPLLLNALRELLTKEHGILLLNTYSLGFPGTSVSQLVRAAFPKAGVTFLDATLQEAERGFHLSTGIATRATW